MSFVPNFEVTQTPGNDSIATVTDLSTGGDVNIVSRKVYLKTGLGTFLVPKGSTTDYVAWVLANASIDIDVLDKDYAILFTVEWIDISGAVLYSKQLNYGLTEYNEDYDYLLTQILASNPLVINDDSFFKHKSLLRNLIDSGNQAILIASDLYAAQLCYDEATTLRINSQYVFNTNA